MTPVTLAVEGLRWGPPSGPMIVRNISFGTEAGRLLVIVGANGAGKSSLLRCLYRFHRPTAGRVTIDGADLWALGAREAARRIAVVLQEMPGDFRFSVREIVAAGRTPHLGLLGQARGQHQAVVEAAMARLEVLTLADRRFDSLSGGEKQRALIARALAQEPGLLILDEPTNHLDIRHRLEILDLLRSLSLTIVTTIHDLDLAAELADDVLVMAGGQAIAHGPPAMILTGAMIRRAFAVDVDIERSEAGMRFNFRLPMPEGPC